MKKLTKENVIERFKNVHGTKYDYSEVEYNGAEQKCKIICHETDEYGIEHGPFYQYPMNHIKGCGCPKCGGNYRLTTEDFKERLLKIHGNTNINLDKVVYVNNSTNCIFVCPEHGDFKRTPVTAYQTIECPECQKERLHNMFAKTKDQFINESVNVHGEKYDYSKFVYNSCDIPGIIICHNIDADGNEHGEFIQTPSTHLGGSGCPKCAKEHMWDKRERLTTEKYLLRALGVHGDVYDYSETEIIDSHHNIIVKCKKHGRFFIDPYSHLKGAGCPICYNENSKSKQEESLYQFIKEIYNGKINKNDRKTINPLEIDIVLPDVGIAFEYDGLYWHSTDKKSDPEYLF
jgi:ribosomal protein L34E